MLRDAARADWASILLLNEEFVHFLSPLDEPRLASLAKVACYFRVAEEGGALGAFLMAFRKGADYDSPNFLWFNARFDDFVYIDRIVVAPAFRGRHLADALYDDIAGFARQADAVQLTCEVNTTPPNPASLRFHERRGFSEVGQQKLSDGAKSVALLECALT